MRSKTIEIRWHDLNAIYSSDFQPFPPQQFKRFISANSAQSNGKQKEKEQVVAGGRSYKLATAGADNHVRLWLIHPNIPDASLINSSSTLQHTSGSATFPPPRAEFLATLQRHSAAVNVVRWSPKEEILASAGDDGVVLLWVPKTNVGNDTAVPTIFGETPGMEVGQKEFWKRKLEIRVTSKEIYDLAWSPDGSHFIVGCTDNSAKIYDATTGSCIKVIAEHSHYVQGVAWDPLNEYIATQSSDRTVHIHRIQQTKNGLEFHPYSRTQKMDVHHSRTPSFSSSSSSSTRPNFHRRGSTAVSDTEGSEYGCNEISTAINTTTDTTAVMAATFSSAPSLPGPPTPSSTISQPGTPLANASMKPPSCRDSFSSSVAASPPPMYSAMERMNGGMPRYGRSPSPLPAVRPGGSGGPTATVTGGSGPSTSTPTPRQGISNTLFGDESFTNYFRRLSFSPDGALLLTPAGQIQSQLLSFPPSPSPSVSSATGDSAVPSSKARRPAVGETGSRPTVYIYSRANLSNAPIAHLPGQKTASIAVKFSPVLYDLNTFNDGTGTREPKTIVVDEHSEQDITVHLGTVDNVDVVKDLPSGELDEGGLDELAEGSEPSHLSSGIAGGGSEVSEINTVGPPPTGSMSPAVFSLPYRMYFAVATQDAVLLYDTQQTSPLAIFKGLHYSGFTDLAWSPDGQSLILSSLDGYCSVVVFDPGELGVIHPTQQHQKQLQALAATLSTSSSHSVSLPPSPALTHSAPVPLVSFAAPVSLSAPVPLPAAQEVVMEDLLIMDAKETEENPSETSAANGGTLKRSAEEDGQRNLSSLLTDVSDSPSTQGPIGLGIGVEVGAPRERLADKPVAEGAAKKKRRIEPTFIGTLD